MTAPELKQCPFCDGHAIGNIGVHRPYIYCECCDVHGPSYDTIEEAITAWNRRADLAAVPAQAPAFDDVGAFLLSVGHGSHSNPTR